MNKNSMIREINAGMLLEYLYPEREKPWRTIDKGVFYRNYSGDILNIYEDEETVELARDGFLHLLPKDLLSDEMELDGSGRKKDWDRQAAYEEMQSRLKLLSEAFLPFDSFQLSASLKVERAVKRLLDEKAYIVLKEVFGFDMKQERDRYVLQAAVLLPYFPVFRGDPGFIRLLLSTILGREVTLSISDYSVTDHTVCSMPRLEYTIRADGLTEEEYIQEMDDIRPLTEFIADRLCPADAFCEFRLRGTNPDSTLLDYNSDIAILQNNVL